MNFRSAGAVLILVNIICLITLLALLTLTRSEGNPINGGSTMFLLEQVTVKKTIQALVANGGEQELHQVQEELMILRGKEEKPSAHFGIEAHNSTEAGISLVLNTDSPVSHVVKLKHENQTLIVQQNGFYYVYSQLVYIFRNGGHYLHRVVVQRVPGKPETEMVLMEDGNFVSNADVRSSLGAVVYLETKSSVMVRSSSKDSIVNSPYSCYFGLFLV